MDDHSRAPHDPTGDADPDGPAPHLPPPSGPGASHLDATGPMDLDELLEDEPQRLPSRPASGGPSMEDETIADAPLVGGALPGDPYVDDLSGGDAETVVAGPVDADATQIVPPVDPEATAIVPPMPRNDLDKTLVTPAVDDQWRAQASVRPSTQPRRDDATGAFPTTEPGRAWFLPVLLGLAGLVFIVGIAYALLVATRDGNTPAPSPTPTPSPPAASTTPPTSPSPSPSISEPSPSATSPSVPADHVDLPDLTGRTLSDAEATLTALGLSYTAVPQTDDTHPQGTVIGMSPGPGQVDATTSVTLTYAVPSSPSPSTPEPSTSSS